MRRFECVGYHKFHDLCILPWTVNQFFKKEKKRRSWEVNVCYFVYVERWDLFKTIWEDYYFFYLDGMLSMEFNEWTWMDMNEWMSDGYN